MRHSLLALALLVALPGSALAETINATVNGMVCAFCATGIEKTLKKEPQVDTIKVDLEKKIVTINTKQGQTISDAKVTHAIKYAGYSVKNIVREK